MPTAKDTPPKVSVARDVSPASVASDGGEKPVREQLKKTTIDTTAKPAAPTSVPTTSAAAAPAAIGRKRSFESVEKETENGDERPASRHARKRSRDVEKTGDEEEGDSGRAATPEEIDTSRQAEAEKLLSPKGKRNREMFSDDVNGSVLEKEKSEETGEAEREAKRPKDVDAKIEGEKKEEKKDAKKEEPAAKVWILFVEQYRSFANLFNSLYLLHFQTFLLPLHLQQVL
jgi:hypothetical protein